MKEVLNNSVTFIVSFTKLRTKERDSKLWTRLGTLNDFLQSGTKNHHQGHLREILTLKQTFSQMKLKSL